MHFIFDVDICSMDQSVWAISCTTITKEAEVPSSLRAYPCRKSPGHWDEMDQPPILPRPLQPPTLTFNYVHWREVPHHEVGMKPRPSPIVVPGMQLFHFTTRLGSQGSA